VKKVEVDMCVDEEEPRVRVYSVRRMPVRGTLVEFVNPREVLFYAGVADDHFSLHANIWVVDESALQSVVDVARRAPMRSDEFAEELARLCTEKGYQHKSECGSVDGVYECVVLCYR